MRTKNYLVLIVVGDGEQQLCCKEYFICYCTLLIKVPFSNLILDVYPKLPQLFPKFLKKFSHQSQLMAKYSSDGDRDVTYDYVNHAQTPCCRSTSRK